MARKFLGSARDDVLIVSWASGGNLPPLLAAGSLLAARDHRVCVLASAAARQPALDAGFDVVDYRRAPDPETETAFEQQASRMMALAAGLEIALDVRDVMAELRPELMIVDCMLPAGIAAGESTGTPTASLVHFPYGLARTQMLRGSGAWTTDRAQLDLTRNSLGLEPTRSDLAAWESAQLLLVTVPNWFDLAADYPANVVHAGPLGVKPAPQEAPATDRRPRILLGFSTTVMQGQIDLIRRVCDALAGQPVDAVLTLGPAVSVEAIDAPHNMETVPYADHDQLLPHTDAVITHGGLGTTLRALAHGKPLLLLPLGRDQQFNAGRVVELGAGVSVPAESSPDKIVSALVELLAQPQYREAAKRAAAAIAADMPDETAAAALSRLADLARRPSSYELMTWKHAGKHSLETPMEHPIAIQPFTLNIDEGVLADLRHRIRRTRWPVRTGAGWDSGVDPDYLRSLLSYWADEFDWRKQERGLNRFQHYLADLDGVRVHFIHERGNGPSPLPIVLTHGFPSSFVEHLDLLPLLTNPAAHGGRAEDAFDVVVTSLPGYGFSDPLPGPMLESTVADLWCRLMRDGLGYTRFGAHGSDAGSGVTIELGLRHPDHLLGIHLSAFYLYPPPEPWPPAVSEFVENSRRERAEYVAYSRLQSTRPRTAAFGLGDSPAGLAAWIVDLFRSFSDCGGDIESRFTRDQLLTNITIYWATACIGPAMRGYYDVTHFAEAPAPGSRVDVPSGFAVFADSYLPGSARPPRELAEHFFDVARWSEMPRGGHFAALEEPQLLAEDLRAFFRPLREASR